MPLRRDSRDRDGFQFDTLSHGSSTSSVQHGLGGMGTVVDMVHTPLQVSGLRHVTNDHLMSSPGQRG